MKYEIMALINNGRQAYVKSGALHQGEAAKAVMVESSDDLTALAGMVSPGSIAYTAGYGSVWQLDAAGSWQDVTEESGGGGGGGGGLLVNTVIGDPPSLDKTYGEIEEALNAGTSVVVREAIAEGYYAIRTITQYGFDVDKYYVYVDSDGYAATAKTDYPTVEQSSV